MSDRSPNATVKLIDFGLSRLPQDGSEMRTICGSPLYVAPEILDMNLSDRHILRQWTCGPSA